MMSFVFFTIGYVLTMLDLMGNYTDILPDVAGCLLLLISVLMLVYKRRLPRWTPVLPGLALAAEILFLIFPTYLWRILAILLHALLMWQVFRMLFPERARGSLAQIRFHSLLIAQVIILLIKAGSGLLGAFPWLAVAALVLTALLVIYVIVTVWQNRPDGSIE